MLYFHWMLYIVVRSPRRCGHMTCIVILCRIMTEEGAFFLWSYIVTIFEVSLGKFSKNKESSFITELIDSLTGFRNMDYYRLCDFPDEFMDEIDEKLKEKKPEILTEKVWYGIEPLYFVTFRLLLLLALPNTILFDDCVGQFG